jgi:hypothetical protein
MLPLNARPHEQETEEQDRPLPVPAPAEGPAPEPPGQARTIGILYDATSERHYEAVKQVVKDIRSQHKEVQALGYYNRRQLPRNRFAKLGLDFFTRKSVNWYMKPGNQIITNFINTEFDILINLNIEKCFPLKYISAKTHARFKIGRYDRRNAPICDMMIQVEDGLPVAEFLGQVLHYLNLINHNAQET